MFTWERRSITRRLTSALLAFGSCSVIISPTCFPTLIVGLSEVIGSWNIIASSRPRRRRISPAGRVVSSRSLYRIFPDAIRAEAGRSPIAASIITLLPEPDSPTMHSSSCGCTVKAMPSTARAGPAGVSNSTTRSDTHSSGSPWYDMPGSRLRSRHPTGLLAFRREALAHELHTSDEQQQYEAGQKAQPWRRLQVVLPVRDHPAQARGGRLDAEPEVGQRRLHGDQNPQVERCHDRDLGNDLRQQVLADDPPARGALRNRGYHVLAAAEG